MSVLYSTSTYLFYTAPAYLAGSVIRSVWGESSSSSTLSTTATEASTNQPSDGQDKLVKEGRSEGRQGEVGGGIDEDEEERELRRAMQEAMRDYYGTTEEDETEFEDTGDIDKVEAVEEEEARSSDRFPIPEFSEISSDLVGLHQPPSPLSLSSSPHSSSFPFNPLQLDEEEQLTSQAISTSPSTSPVFLESALEPTSPLLGPSRLPPSSPAPSESFRILPNSDMSLFRRSQSLSTSLSRLSHRATLCLSTFYTSAPSTSRDLPEEEKEVLIERVLEDERKGVEEALERFVKDIEGREERDKEKGELKEDQGWSWFGKQKDSDYKDFNDVSWTSEKGTNAEDFCLACEGLVRLAEHLAPGLAGLCTSDIVGEVKKIRTRTQVEGVETLEQIVVVERGQRRKIATDAVDWLLLMLKFGSTAYQYNLKSKEELSVSFTRAWDEEYYKYYNFLVRPLFKIVIKACPSRQTFYSKLGSPVEMVEKDFGNWLDGVDVVAERIEKWEKENKEGLKRKKGK